MRCHDICEKLSAYIDGMLEQSDASLVEQHLKSCPACQMEYDDLLATVELVKNLPPVEPPPGFRDALKKRLIAKPAPRRLFFGGRWAGMVAAAAVIFITVGVTALWYGERGGMQLIPGGYGEQDKISTLAGNIKQTERTQAQKAADSAADLRKATTTPAPGAEENASLDVREAPENMQAPAEPEETTVTEANPEAPAAAKLQSSAGGARDGRAEQENVPENIAEDNYLFRALINQDKAVGNAAPLVAGDGPDQVVEYSLTLDVDDKQKAIEQVDSMAAEHGGFAEAGQDDADYMLVTVPFYNAQTLVEEVEQLGTVTGRQSEEKDMSAEIERLEKNISELSAREKYLAEKYQAGQTDQATEEELSQLREQIGGLQEQLNAINTSIIMTRVELKLK